MEGCKPAFVTTVRGGPKWEDRLWNEVGCWKRANRCGCWVARWVQNRNAVTLDTGAVLSCNPRPIRVFLISAPTSFGKETPYLGQSEYPNWVVRPHDDGPVSFTRNGGDPSKHLGIIDDGSVTVTNDSCRIKQYMFQGPSRAQVYQIFITPKEDVDHSAFLNHVHQFLDKEERVKRHHLLCPRLGLDPNKLGTFQVLVSCDDITCLDKIYGSFTGMPARGHREISPYVAKATYSLCEETKFEDPRYQGLFIRRIFICKSRSVIRGLVFELASGQRTGTLLSADGENLELDDDNAEASGGHWLDVQEDDYIVKIKGHNLKGRSGAGLCQTVELEFASGQVEKFRSDSDGDCRGEPFEYQPPASFLVEALKFSDGEFTGVEGTSLVDTPAVPTDPVNCYILHVVITMSGDNDFLPFMERLSDYMVDLKGLKRWHVLYPKLQLAARELGSVQLLIHSYTTEALKLLLSALRGLEPRWKFTQFVKSVSTGLWEDATPSHKSSDNTGKEESPQPIHVFL